MRSLSGLTVRSPKLTGPRGLWRELVIDLVLILVVYLGAILTLGHFQVVGRSMFPNLVEGQHLLVDRVTPRLGLLGRGDIVVIDPVAGLDHDLVKRVIGLPGETVAIVNGVVQINGRPLDEPYAAGYLGSDHTWQLGQDVYFLMGDNRGASSDNRAWGPLARGHVMGRAFAVIWPLSAAHWVDRPGYLSELPRP